MIQIDSSLSDFFDRHVATASASNIEATVVAVDATYFLNRLHGDYVAPLSRCRDVHTQLVDEPLMSVSGGTPTTLEYALEIELRKWEELKLQPLFVFPGVVPKPSSNDIQYTLKNDVLAEGAKEREYVWSAIEAGNTTVEEYVHNFAQICHPKLLSDSSLSHAMHLLRKLGYEAIKAPYAALGQIAYFIKHNMVHFGFASPELLLYESCARVVVELNIDTKEFYYLERHAVWSSFPARSREYQYVNFLDTVLLASSLPPTMCGEDRIHTASQNLAQAKGNVTEVLQILPQPLDGASDATQALQDRQQKHFRSRNVYCHPIVLNTDCRCVPITNREDRTHTELPTPCNLSDIWGDRVSDMLYYLHSVDAVSTSLLTDLAHNCFRERTPMVDTVEYREVLEKVVPLRTQVMFQIIHALSQDQTSHFHQRPKMSWYRWFHHRETTVLWPPQITLGEWDVTGFTGELNFDVVFEYAENARRAGSHSYRTLNDVVIAVHMKALDLLGYFTHSTVSTTSGIEETSGLSVYCEALKEIAEPHKEFAVYFIEMLRTKSLRSGEQYNYNVNRPPAQQQQQQQQQVSPPVTGSKISQSSMHRLICRVMCLVIPKLKKDTPWIQGTSRDLCAFLAIVKAISKTLRGLAEVICANLFLIPKMVDVDYFEHNAENLREKLPFGREPAVYMGIIMETILKFEDESDLTIQALAERFPCVEDIAADLERAFAFWGQIMNLLTVLDKPEKDNETPVACQDLVTEFRRADVIVARKKMVLFPHYYNDAQEK
eukprot:PhF_6_TR25297/c0_g1_i1/m.34911